MKKSFVLFLPLYLCMLNIANAHSAAEHDAGIPQGYLSIESTPPAVQVYDDSLLLGVTPFVNLPIKAGTHILRYIQLEQRRWPSVSFVETLLVNEDEHIRKNISLPIIYHITSEPYGAEVVLEDTTVGVTPCFVSLPVSNKIVTLKKAGYVDAKVLLTDEMQRAHIVLLSASDQEDNRSYLVKESAANDIPLYVCAAATITSGVAAVYFKVKADNVYAHYQQSGNAALVQQVKHYDTISGISLAASEFSLALFTYFLLSR